MIMATGTTMRTTKTVTLLAALIACMALIGIAQAQTLRERLKERIEARRAGTAGSEPTAADAPGTHEEVIELAGQRRKVIVHVPKGYDPRNATPLVLAFHGGGGDAAFMADDQKYGLVSKSEQAGFIAVFPNGYSKLPGGRFATWNAGACCGDARDKRVDDVAFTQALVAWAAQRYNVDRRRVYATGMSNGGMLAHRLACELPQVFAAVASVAGTDNTAECQPSTPVAVLHIHARDDDHVLFNGGAGPGVFRDESKVTDFTAVPVTVSRWVARNQCSATPQRTLQTAGAYCDTYSGCRDGREVQLCVTDTGGHSWPGASQVRRGKEPASQALSANDVIWDFFSRNARR